MYDLVQDSKSVAPNIKRQTKIKKVIMQPQGDSSEMESELDSDADFSGLDTEVELAMTPDQLAVKAEKQFKSPNKRDQRVFQYIKPLDSRLTIPDMRDPSRITLFIEIDQVFMCTFLCDPNFGYMTNPGSRDHDFEILIEETKQPVLCYERNHMQTFLDFLIDNKHKYETILYTRSSKNYTDRLVKVLDQHRQLFEHVLYQNANNLFEKPDENIYMLVKDITRFKNRDMRKSILLDTNSMDFLMSPENVIPVNPYEATANEEDDKKDDYLLNLIQ